MGSPKFEYLAALFCALSCMAMVVQVSVAQNTPQDFLQPHNAARAQVRVPPMQWNDTVAAFARNYAGQRMADCRLIHSGGPYGENIFWGSGREFAAVDAVNSWVSERQFYNYDTNGCAAGQQCGHYTQVVWRSSLQLGCARVRCNNGAIFITCNYYPRGNYIGQRPY